MNFNYRIVEHSNGSDNVIIDFPNVEIFFTNMSPIQQANQVLTLYNKITPPEELSTYDGTFSLYTRDMPSNEMQEIFTVIFKTLLECEKENKIISVEVQLLEYDENNNLIMTFYSPILDHAQIALTTKTFRADIHEPIINMVSMVYKNTIE